MKRFEVEIYRDGKWWMVRIPEIDGLTQARRLAEAGQMAADYIALDQDLALSEVEVDVVSVDVAGMDVHRAGELVAQLRDEVRVLEALIAQLTSATARELVSERVPLRDIAEVLGVSHQRVAQIAGESERVDHILVDDDVLLANLDRIAAGVVAPVAASIGGLHAEAAADVWRARNAAVLKSIDALAPSRAVFDEINQALAPLRERMQAVQIVAGKASAAGRLTARTRDAMAHHERAQLTAARALAIQMGKDGHREEGGAMGKGNDNDRYVVPNKERGGWDVVKEDHERASAHTSTKKEAVDRARQIVENAGGGEVRQADKQGRFNDSDTTKHGRESRARDKK